MVLTAIKIQCKYIEFIKIQFQVLLSNPLHLISIASKRKPSFVTKHFQNNSKIRTPKNRQPIRSRDCKSSEASVGERATKKGSKKGAVVSHEGNWHEKGERSSSVKLK